MIAPVSAQPRRSLEKSTGNRNERWPEALVWLWTLVMVSADIKVINGVYVHWAVTLIVAFLAAPGLLRLRYSARTPLLLAAFGLIVATLLAAFNSHEALYGLEQALKFAVILLGGLMLFSSHPRYALVAFRAFLFSVYLNAVLLLVGLFVNPVAASQMAWGRWGTALNYPGALWRCGALVLVYSISLLIEPQGRTLKPLLLLLCGLMLILADGSRTALIALPLAALYCAVAMPRARAMLAKALVPTLVTVGLVLAFFTTSVMFTAAEHSEGGVARVQEMILDYSLRGVEGLREADPTRAAMLEDGLAAVLRHPLLGGGIGTTRSETDVGPMEIHMSYLQAWGDLGILGMVSYVALIAGGLALGLRSGRLIRSLKSPVERAACYNAVFLLISFAFAGLFHPMSTEWSEWVSYVVPVGLLSRLGDRRAFPEGV
jgi:O-antigen ligase